VSAKWRRSRSSPKTTNPPRTEIFRIESPYCSAAKSRSVALWSADWHLALLFPSRASSVRPRRFVVLFACALAAGYAVRALLFAAHRQPPNVSFIVIDTLRADRLGAYGNQRGLTPFLDEPAEKGVVFENTYAPSSWTMPSVASLFTSRLPSQHRVAAFDSKIAEREVTLAEKPCKTSGQRWPNAPIPLPTGARSTRRRRRGCARSAMSCEAEPKGSTQWGRRPPYAAVRKRRVWTI
jgi:Sulfatase